MKRNEAASIVDKAGTSATGCVNLDNYLQAVIDSLGDELIVIDRDYRIIEANKVFLSRHGKGKPEVIGQYCYVICHGTPKPCQPPSHECPVKATWNTGKVSLVNHTHVYSVEGERRERYLEIITSPLTDSRGNVTAVAELVRDVTGTKEMELKIAKANEALLAINTITNVVTQSLDLDTVLSSALDKTLEIMQRSTGGILLLDEGGKTLHYQVYRGLSDGYAKEMCLKLGEGIAGRVAQSGEAILVEDISTDTHAARLDLIAKEGIRAFACVPLRSKERVLGVLNVASHEAHKFSPEDVQLLNSIAAQVTVAIENAKLHQEVQRKEEIRGELLQDALSIQEEERRRIARELHDETSQILASLTASLEAAIGVLPANVDKTRALLKKAQALSVNILDEIHRLIYELRPTLLDDLGLVAAIRWLTDNNLETAGVSVNFKTTGQVRRLVPQLETTLFRVIQEAVNNTAKHAHATSAAVDIHFRKDMVRVCIRDDGRGFDVEEAISSKDRPRGLGLLGMRERIEIVNGTLSIQSCPGGGTKIDIEIPLDQEASNG